MKGRLFLLVSLLLLPVGLLSAAGQPLALGQIPPAVARGKLLPLGRWPGTNQLRLALSLPLRDPAGLTNLLTAIYSPGSPQHHHYLTPAQFADRFGPTPAQYAAVAQFARTNGFAVSATHRDRLVLEVVGRAADAERAFHVQLHRYRHPNEPRDFFAPDTAPTVDPRLPLLHVSGLDDFDLRHPQLVLTQTPPPVGWQPSDGSGPGGAFVGNDFRQAYLPGTPLTGAGQSVALVEFDTYRPADIAAYEDLIGLTNDVPQVTIVPVDGGVPSPGANISEVTLDIDAILAMSPGVSNIFVYEATNGVSWEAMFGQIADDNLAAQVSCSWSDASGRPDPAAEQIFMQMAAQGQSIFNAAGDTGAYTNVAPYPCGSPNITQCGGTYLLTDTNGNYAEEAVWNSGNGYIGSGGVALGVEIPAWQMGIDMSVNNGSTMWRNVPDVALTAANVYVIVDNQGSALGGTSCAAPLWAGLTALINQQASQLRQPPVGFLNPALYAICEGTNYDSILHDITEGNNTNAVSQTNFWAVPGFDLCTGWGTPAGTNLINALTTPDLLGVSPPANPVSVGLVGGPFSVTNWMITVTNAGPKPLGWALGTGLPPWLAASLSGGTLAAHAATNLTVRLVHAELLPAGDYNGPLMFTNQPMSRVQNIAVRLTITSSLAQNLVLNGGFETGDFSDWTLVGDTRTMYAVDNIVTTAADYPGVVHSGIYGAFLGQDGYLATLSQVVPTTPGQSYLVSYWLDDLIALPPAQQGSLVQQFNALWAGTNLVSLADPPAFAWSNFVFVVTAADTNATLEFDVENDNNYFGLDDVSVTPFPPLVFSGYSVSTNGFLMTWPAVAGLTYTIQYTSDLTQDNWQPIGTVTAVTNSCTFLDPNCSPSSPPAFYQLVLPP